MGCSLSTRATVPTQSQIHGGSPNAPPLPRTLLTSQGPDIKMAKLSDGMPKPDSSLLSPKTPRSWLSDGSLPPAPGLPWTSLAQDRCRDVVTAMEINSARSSTTDACTQTPYDPGEREFMRKVQEMIYENFENQRARASPNAAPMAAIATGMPPRPASLQVPDAQPQSEQSATVMDSLKSCIGARSFMREGKGNNVSWRWDH